MRVPSVAILILLACVIVAGAAEPTYQGNPLADWLKALTGNDPVVRRDAARALGQLGADSPDAVPALVKALGDPDDEVRRLAVASLGEIRPDAKLVIEPLAGALKDRIASVRQQAAVVLGEYGPAAKSALPALVARVRNPGEGGGVRQQASRAIGRIGPEAKEAVPALIGMLDSGDGSMLWWYAAEALAQIGPDALPAVVAILRKPDGSINARAMDAAGRFGRSGAPALRDALKARDPAVQLAAASALVYASPEDAAPARPILDAAVRDPNSIRRSTALNALRHLNFMTKPSVDGLVAALRDPLPAVRSDAATVLADHGAGGRDALPALGEALKDSVPEVQFRAAIAIARIDPDSPESVVGLLKATKDGLHDYQVNQALDRLGRGTLPGLEKALKDDDAHIRGVAALTMVRTDRRTWKTALPALTEWVTASERVRDRNALARVRDLDPPVRTALAKALLLAFEGKGNGPQLDVAETPFGPLFDGPELDALCLALVDAAKERVGSARALEKIRTLGPRAAAAVPGLLAIWKKQREAGREPELGLLQALGAIGPEARGAVPLLVDSLTAEGARRDEVVSTLGKIGPDAKAAVPALVKLLKDKPDAHLLPLLIEALGQIGPAADEAAPLLADLLRQKDGTVHERVIAALPRIGNKSKAVLAALKEFIEAQKPPKPPLAGRAALALLQLDPGSTLACRGVVEAVDQYGNPTLSWRDVEPILKAHPGAVTPSLAEALLDTRLNGHQRALAAVGLRALGPDARGARKSLRVALTDGDRTVRVAAALALATVDPSVVDAVGPLVDALGRPATYSTGYSYEDRKTGTIGGRPGVPALLPRFGKAAVPHLVAALKSSREYQRQGAAEALGDIGPDARDAADELLRVLKEDPNLTVRAAAGLALGQVAPARTEAVAPLLVLLKDPKFDVRVRACQAVGRFGKSARDARETLVELATHERHRVGLRTPALRSLIGIGAEEAVAALGRHLRRPENYEVSPTEDFELIRDLGPRAKPLTEPLRDLLGSRIMHVRIRAARALAHVNPAHLNEVIEVLEPELHHSYWGNRFSAARALEDIGPPAKAAVGVLTKLLKDEHLWVREAAADALKQIDPDAAKAAGVP